MKRKIFAYLLLISFIVLSLTLVLTTIVNRTAFVAQTRSDLEQLTDVIAASCGYEADVRELRGLETDLRVTLVASSGEVLFDSRTGEALENHGNRPEIIEARESGEGHSRRTSETLGREVYYYATLLEDGTVLRVGLETSTALAQYFRVVIVLAAVFAAVMALAFLLSRLLTRRLVSPIEKMAENLDAIGESVPYPELERFAQNVKLQQDARNEAAELRRDFTANVTHELKTPLTSISGYAEMIAAGIAQPEDVPDFARRIHSEASRLLTLIGDIIALSELDSLKALDDFEETDLFALAKNICGYLSLSAEKSGVRLSVDGEPTAMRGSVTKLEELLYNLCDNAIRYNRPQGEVRILVGSDGGRPFVSISDTGIGIPEDRQDRIFERFYRVDKGRSKKTGGTGLGLAIVKHIALLHSAGLSLESVYGEGTKITVTFPKEGEN